MDTTSDRQVLKKTLDTFLRQYICDTLSDICILENFLDRKDKWFLQREMEVEMMSDIRDRKGKISLTYDHVQQSQDKFKAFGEFLWSGMSSVTADSRRQELEKELDSVLQDTLEGLVKLRCFLNAVEELAVTSLFVFTNGDYLPKGMKAADVRSVIFAARMAAPLLVHFKRDDMSFFLPSLNNVEVLLFHLDKYIRISQQICEGLEKRTKKSLSSVARSWRVLNCDQAIKVNEKTSEESIEKMLDHIDQLNMIRTNQDVRLTFLFQTSALSFIGLFSQRHSRMEQFLSDLEESARQLDNMKFGANISTVAGSSVGVVGGVLSIVGLALAPVTAGVSLALTLSGVGLGVTSGVNSLVTGITEMAVNKKHGTEAQNTFQRFMEDVQKLGDCLEMVGSLEGNALVLAEQNVAVGVGKAMGTACAIGKQIDALVDSASAVKLIQTEEVAVTAMNLLVQEAKAGRNIPKLAADLPDIGQMAKGTPLALSKSARSGFIALNALFIGLDVLFICKDSISLSKGSKNEMAQLIRSRAALWRSELDSWEKMHDSLCRGIWRFRRSQTILEQPFYPK
ncbi:apolipoprotein L4 isoform X1 [Engraulis encrasicolus]|uniref:apolipoprotein L4 isoform X1 n=1 Tax=Engraulis encrasicolus TaxID=184585 RepID=UPI002FD13A61